MPGKTFMATTGHGIARASCGQGDRWAVEHRLTDHDVRCLTADPHNRQVVYAGTRGNGVLRSDDGGRTWQSAGLAGQIVKALAVSSIKPGVIYAGTKPPLLFVSRDSGANWTELDSFRRMRRWFWFTPAEPGDPYIQAIALSPTDPDVIVVGVEFGAVLRSADGGKSWQGHLKGAVRDCHALTFHATNGSWVYEAGGTGASVSRDGGKTWRQPDPTTLMDILQLTRGGGVRPSPGGLDRRYGFAVAADPARPDTWYISASPGAFQAHGNGKAEAYIFRSTGGAPWQKLSGGLPQPLPYMPYALLTDPAAPGHLYAGLSNGDVWHSPDYGDHWQQLPFNLTGVHQAMIML